MPDFTLCPGLDCPLKENCNRYLLKPSEYQSYFWELPVKDGDCLYFMPIKNEDPRSNSTQ